MIFLRQLAAVILLSLSFFACTHYSKDDATASIQNVAMQETPAPPAGNDNKQQAPKQVPTAAPAPNIDWDKKIIKNATVAVEVKDYKHFNEFVHATVKKWGGYIAQEEQNESGYKIENTIIIKVPVAQFDNAVNELVPGKEKVLTKKITSEDVTGEVVDTRSRMEAKQQARQRYLDFLKQAKNMGEVLQVQKEINDIQLEIESATGRVNYLTHAAAYSTIQLTFYQVLNEQAERNTEPGFGKRVLLALQDGLEWVGELIVLLLTLWPLWLALTAVLWGIKKWRVSRKDFAQKRQDVKQA